MLAKVFALAVFALSASASVIGHEHLGHHHQYSLRFVKRAASSSPQVVERRFGSSGPLTSIPRSRRRQRRALGSKQKFCQAPTSVEIPPLTTTTTTTTATTEETPESTTEKETTTTEEPDPTTSTKPPKPTDDTPSGSGKMFTGEMTFYDTGLGACGITNKDTDMIAAVSTMMFDTFPGYKGGNPNNNPICKKRARVMLEGKEIEIMVTDRCVGCAQYDLDLSPHAFEQLADKGRGRIAGMKWQWI